VQIAADVSGEGAGGLVAAVAVLLQRLQSDERYRRP
jgi:hypothetical protein